MNKEEYNKIPVCYCTNCLSLAIITGDEYDFCEHCGSIDINTCTIDTWEKMYVDHYGEKYVK